MARTARTDSTPSRMIGYVRVSTDKQAQDGVSLEAQQRKLELWAELHGAELVEIIVDAGASAKSLDRDGLQRALALLAAGEADGLLVAKLDRLTRSVVDLGQLLDHYFTASGADSGADLVSVAEQVDTRSPSGRLVLNVLMSVAQWEREATAQRTSAAMQHKRAQGEYTGGRAPYGWATTDDGTLVAVADEQAVIVKARELREAGLSLRKVGAELERLGHRTRKGGSWAASQIKVVLAARLDGEAA